MDQLKPPSAFSFDGNVSKEWKQWKRSFKFFLAATESDGKSDKIKTSILLTCIGSKGREIYDSFTFEAVGDEMKLDAVVKCFDDYCEPRKNITMARHKFLTHKQVLGQSFNEFVTELKNLSEDCELGTLKDSPVKDIIICGVNDRQLKERYLREDGVDLIKVIKIGQAAEQTKLHARELHGGDPNVNEINELKRRGQNYAFSSRKNIIDNCRYCGRSHLKGTCPAYGKVCVNCSKPNHFAAVCRSREIIKPHNDIRNKSVRSIEQSHSNSQNDCDEYFIDAITFIDLNSEFNCDGMHSNYNGSFNKAKINVDFSVSDDTVNNISINYNSSSAWTQMLRTQGF